MAQQVKPRVKENVELRVKQNMKLRPNPNISLYSFSWPLSANSNISGSMSTWCLVFSHALGNVFEGQRSTAALPTTAFMYLPCAFLHELSFKISVECHA